jgi:hypothetical protein
MTCVHKAVLQECKTQASIAPVTGSAPSSLHEALHFTLSQCFPFLHPKPRERLHASNVTVISGVSGALSRSASKISSSQHTSRLILTENMRCFRSIKVWKLNESLGPFAISSISDPDSPWYAPVTVSKLRKVRQLLVH